MGRVGCSVGVWAQLLYCRLLGKGVGGVAQLAVSVTE